MEGEELEGAELEAEDEHGEIAPHNSEDDSDDGVRVRDGVGGIKGERVRRLVAQFCF